MDRLSWSLYAAYPDAYCPHALPSIGKFGFLFAWPKSEVYYELYKKHQHGDREGQQHIVNGFLRICTLASAMRSDIYIWNWFNLSKKNGIGSKLQMRRVLL
jgi:hypothetical protein